MEGVLKAFRIVSESDLPAAFAIRREVFVIEQGIDVSLEYDEYDRPGLGTAHFLATCGGIPAGAARLIPWQEGWAKLQRMAVLPRFRGLGIGRLLAEKAEEEARASGARGIVLHAQLTARTFYEKIGYSAEGPVFFEAGVEHVRMRKPF